MVMMGVKIFLDTNILLRSTLPRFPEYEKVYAFVSQYFDDNYELWISRQIIREYIAQCTRPQNFVKPLSTEEIVEQVKGFYGLFKIADETEVVTQKLLQLIQTYQIGGKQIHDANIVATMLANEIEQLITLNHSDFKRYEPKISLITVS